MPVSGSLAYINLYLLEDHQGWWIVNTGLANRDTEAVWEEVFANELGDKPVVGVICTHMHPDHIGQAKTITDRFQCSLYMNQGEYYQARAFSNGSRNSRSGWISEKFYTQVGMPGDYLQQLAKKWEGRESEGMSMPSMAQGYERLQDGQLLRIGDTDWQIIVGAGHSPEHACLYSSVLKVLISGDQILPVITSNVSVHPTEPNANPLKNWMDSHDHFLAVIPEDTFVLPAHNLPFFGVRPRLRDLTNHHEDRMLAIEEACVEPQIAKDLLPVLFARELDSRQMMMALGEAIAHIHLLMHRNRLQRTLDENGVFRFLSVDPSLSRRAHPDDHEAPNDQPAYV